jgi:alpha,alpha-trehalase
MSNTNTGLQWDEPFGWAPTNWVAIAGLEAEGFHADAARVAQHFDATVDQGFAEDGTIREKYNVATRSSEAPVASGYQQNVVGFGWTNGVLRKMLVLDPKAVEGTRCATKAQGDDRK